MVLTPAQVREKVNLHLQKISYKAKDRVLADVVDLASQCPSLQPAVDSYVHNDGTTVQLMKLVGTVPIYFSGVQYNIPMAVWIPLNYPIDRPFCFVTPTADMVIKHKHPHVDASGMCYHMYLTEWEPRDHNLAGLITMLSSVFGQDPPVFAKASGGGGAAGHYGTGSTVTNPATPGFSHPPRPFSGVAPSPSPAPRPAAVAARPAAVPAPQPAGPTAWNPTYNPPYMYEQPPAQQPRPAGFEFGTGVAGPRPPGYDFGAGAAVARPPAPTSEETKKQTSIQMITNRMQRRMKEILDSSQGQIDAANNRKTQADLAKQQAEAELMMIRRKKIELENEIKKAKEAEEQNERWLSSHSGNEVDAIALAAPKDVLSNQLVDCHSEIDAIDDALWRLEKMLAHHNSKIDLPTYLRGVRELTKRQFECKYLAKKIARRRHELGVE